MTPKERVKTALAHREADRVPVGEETIEYTITERLLGRETFYRARWKEMNALWQGRRDEVVESAKRDIVDLIRRFGLDLYSVPLTYSATDNYSMPEFLDEHTFKDAAGNVRKYFPQTQDVVTVVPSEDVRIKTAGDLVKAAKDASIEEVDDSRLEVIRHVVNELGQTHFVLARCFEGGYIDMLFGDIAKTMVALLDETTTMRELVELQTDKAIAYVKAVASTGVDGIHLGADFADKNGPMCSPQIYEEVYLPPLKRLMDAIHDQHLPVFRHQCGNNWKLLDFWVEAGMDCYNSIDHTCMDIREMKNKYGDRLTLWGNVDTGETLTHGSCEDVRKEVEQLLCDVAPGGGFILGSSHSIHYAVKYENYITMLDMSKAKGGYPIET